MPIIDRNSTHLLEDVFEWGMGKMLEDIFDSFRINGEWTHFPRESADDIDDPKLCWMMKLDTAADWFGEDFPFHLSVTPESFANSIIGMFKIYDRSTLQGTINLWREALDGAEKLLAELPSEEK